MIPCPTSDFTELVTSLWAHLPIATTGDLHAPALVRWWQAQDLDDDVRALLVRDAPVLTAAWRARPERDAWHAWAELFADLARFAGARARALAELAPADVDAPALLAALRDDPAAELVHADLAIWAPSFARVHRDVIAPALIGACRAAAPWLAQASARMPSLADHRVELAWSLGPHGRGLPGRIVVGAPARWHDGDPIHPAVMAMHEHAVRDLAVGDHAAREWSALVRVARLFAGSDDPLAAAHARWCRGLDLRDLVAALAPRWPGRAGELAAVRDDPAGRVARLAAWSDELRA